MKVIKEKRPAMTRSQVMARVKSKNTRPELLVRKLAHGAGYRYRLHVRALPGSPDLVFGPRRKTIFVHGCFWHGHACRLGDRPPKSRQEFWGPKIARNVERDAESLSRLSALGWESLVIWECELADLDAVGARITGFLGPISRHSLDATRPMGSTVTAIQGQGL